MKNKLLEMGYSLIPLHGIKDGKCTCGRPDCSSPGKHPITKNGVKDASNDPKIVEKWERTHQNCNFGVAAGRSNNLVVVDVDLDHGADGSIDKLTNDGKSFPDTFTVKTGGGFHLYFTHPDCDINNKVSVVPGIDIRADGGYVVGPGSIHSNGTTYSIVKDTTPVSLPSWAVDLIKAPKTVSAEPKSQLFSNGERNARLYSIGRSNHAKGVSNEIIAAIIREANATQCETPLGDSEVNSIINSVLTGKNTTEFEEKQLQLKKSLENGIKFSPIKFNDFMKKTFPSQGFIVDGIIAKQSFILIGAPPKAGKTTLIYSLIGSIINGTKFIDLEVEKSKVLLLAVEESDGMVQERFKQFGITCKEDMFDLFVAPATLTDAFIKDVADFVIKNETKLLVIDTLAMFAKFENESDNSQSLLKIAPLLALRDLCGVSILAVHHTKKNPQNDDIIAAFRGASAITAAADSLIWLKEERRHRSDGDEKENQEDTNELDPRDYQRKLFIKGRLAGPPLKIKIKLDPLTNTFNIVGNSKKQLLNRALDRIYSVLNGKPLSAKEIADRTRLTERSIYNYISELEDLGQVEKVLVTKFPPKSGFIRGKKQRKLV